MSPQSQQQPPIIAMLRQSGSRVASSTSSTRALVHSPILTTLYNTTPIFHNVKRGHAVRASASEEEVQQVQTQTDLHLAKIKQGWDAEDELRYAADPKPWYMLLKPAARAAWRASPSPPSHLSQVQNTLLTDYGGRTNRQLKRTYKFMKQTHALLSERREMERRRLAVAGDDTYTHKVSLAISSPETPKERKTRWAHLKDTQPLYYTPEQTLVSLHQRLLPNFAIVKRVLAEVKALLAAQHSFHPKKILDMGIGVGSASVAALHVFPESLQYIHGVDPSKSQREVAEMVLKDAVKNLHHHNANHSNAATIPTMPTTVQLSFTEALSGTGAGKSARKTGGRTAAKLGEMDLILCCYTAQELPHTAATLAMSAILWERLAPGGVMVVVEPGTPDGFNTVRSIREMLLECCPPFSDDDDKEDLVNHHKEPREECHVIAPCTHNGRCPMVRHWNDEEINNELGTTQTMHETRQHAMERNKHHNYQQQYHQQQQTQKPYKNKKERLPKHMSTMSAFDTSFCSFVHFMPGGERKQEKMTYLVVQKRNRNHRPEPSFNFDFDMDHRNEQEYHESTSRHCIKEVPDTDAKREKHQVHHFNTVDLLAEAMRRSQEIEHDTHDDHHDNNTHDDYYDFKQDFENYDYEEEDDDDDDEEAQDDNFDYTNDQLHLHEDYPMQQALKLEREFRANLSDDNLGLHVIQGDTISQYPVNLHSWGRLIRAPLKNRGHVLVDYCTADHRTGDGKKGRIIRHRVGKQSTLQRGAPGMFHAARKARWGGLWPDLSERLPRQTDDDHEQ